MAFLLNSQAQGASGKMNIIYPNTMARGPMQLHRLKAGPVNMSLSHKSIFQTVLYKIQNSNYIIVLIIVYHPSEIG